MQRSRGSTWTRTCCLGQDCTALLAVTPDHGAAVAARVLGNAQTKIANCRQLLRNTCTVIAKILRGRQTASLSGWASQRHHRQTGEEQAQYLPRTPCRAAQRQLLHTCCSHCRRGSPEGAGAQLAQDLVLGGKGIGIGQLQVDLQQAQLQYACCPSKKAAGAAPAPAGVLHEEGGELCTVPG